MFVRSEVNVSKIFLKVSTGEVFSVSHGVYGKDGPLSGLTHTQIEIQMQFIPTKLAFVQTDQEKLVPVGQIVYLWVED